jgi:hypothetical protein
MKLNKFLEKFTSDYREKIEEVMSKKDETTRIYCHHLFQAMLFPEALQNFADRICEEQRKLCADLYNEEIGYKEPDNNIYNRILEYEQPKIDEL